MQLGLMSLGTVYVLSKSSVVCATYRNRDPLAIYQVRRCGHQTGWEAHCRDSPEIEMEVLAVYCGGKVKISLGPVGANSTSSNGLRH